MIVIQLENINFGVQELQPGVKMLVLRDPQTEIQVRVPMEDAAALNMAQQLSGKGGGGLVVPTPRVPSDLNGETG